MDFNKVNIIFLVGNRGLAPVSILKHSSPRFRGQDAGQKVWGSKKPKRPWEAGPKIPF